MLCLLTTMLQAQKSAKTDKVYTANGFGKYMELNGEDYASMDKETLERMGVASRKTGDTRIAEKVYATLLEKGNNNPLNHLYYAQALQSNGRYLKAREHFQICDEKLQDKANGKPYDQRARLGYEACNRIAEMRALGEVSIENEIILNTSKFDFSPTYYKRGVLFVSTRNKMGNKRDRWLNDNFMDLYYAPLAAGNELDKPINFSTDLNTDLHEGPSVFSGDEKRIYFTRNDLNKGKRGKAKDGTTKLKIYTAKYIDEKWEEIEELPFNDTEYDVCHPAISPDERMLVFAANLPGGYGGMDLWVSKLEKNTWQKPINLGAKINTEGNEVFPFIQKDGTLFYSSNGLSTLGGLDIFMATQIFNHPDSLWEYPFNLGEPINSSADDFGIIMNNSKTEGFLTSSREGGAGGDDIYRFKIKDGLDEVKPTPALPIDICVYSDETRERLSNAEIKIRRVAKIEAPTVSYVTNEYGYTSCEMRAGEQYVIDVIRYGYRDMKETFIMPNTVDGLDEFCIGLIRNPSIAIQEQPTIAATNNPNKIGTINAQGQIIDRTTIAPLTAIVYEYNPEEPIEGPQVSGQVTNVEYNRALPRAQVFLLNRCTGEELVMEVGEDGRYAFPLECGCEYIVRGDKQRFLDDKAMISLVNEVNCQNPIVVDLGLQPDFDSNYGEGSFSTPVLENLKEGDVIELKNIYYDYDKATIRVDAARDLDDLIKLMKQYPTMEIELSSHTDIRGSNDYNEQLSDERAQTASQYLAAGGIEKNRIQAKGYGEKQLKNNCKFCTESDHQQNRRTEVRIIKLDK